MPLLWKSKKSKILTLQTGGSIPFYQQYQVQFANQPVANPGALLQKYANATPVETKKEKDKTSAASDLKLKGLNNDVAVLTDQLSSIETDIEKLYNNGADASHPLVQDLTRQYNNIITFGANKAELSRQQWEDAKKNIESKDNRAQGTIVFDNGMMLATQSTINEKGKVVEQKIDWFDPKEINNPASNIQYNPITYSEALEIRNNSRDSKFAFDDNITGKIGKGLSIQAAFKDIIAPYYENIGNYAEGKKIINKEGGYTIDEKQIKEILTGYDKESNQEEAKHAFNQVISTIADEPAYNALMATAWRTPIKTKNEKGELVNRLPINEEEAEKNMYYLLTEDLAKRFKISVKTIDKESETTTPTKTGSSEGSATMAPVSKYYMEILNPSDKPFIYEHKSESGDKNVVTAYLGKNSEALSADISNAISKNIYQEENKDGDQTMKSDIPVDIVLKNINVGNGVLNNSNIQDAMFENGVKLKDMPGVYDKMVVGNQKVSIVDVPVTSNGKPIVMTPELLTSLASEVATIKSKYKKGIDAGLTLPQEQMKKELDKVAEKFGGYKMNEFYMLQASVDNYAEEQEGTYDKIKDVAIKVGNTPINRESYIMALKKGLGTTTYESMKTEVENNGLLDYDYGSYLNKYNLLIPVPSIQVLQKADGDAYTEKTNLTVAELSKEEQYRKNRSAKILVK